ncbi:DUF3472 domain-containing protein [Brucella intermedia]|uniref:DUF3472 domain-containing protein n=1 Tax=Brucella intermedia TaxID=94625 RepID=UPI00124C1F58|nr:RICIN domain-containing protein [Brucella intermedia]KAB2719220.1 hypothetical protein F9L02_23480 [Brucella intermedia]
MTFLKLVNSILCSLALSLAPTIAEGTEYATITNKYKSDVGGDRCLRTFSNTNVVAIGGCDAQGGASYYTSMRLWEVEEQSNGIYLLKNKYRKDANLGQCLRVFGDSNDLAVDDCNSHDNEHYPESMRLWKLVDNNGYVSMHNLYKIDSGTPNCLRTFSNNNSVLIGDCVAQGGASDYTSMRQWLSESFPFDRPWQPTGIVRIPYKISQAPSAGLNSIVFPMTILKSPEERGYYYAMQYNFINGNTGYIGLQPRGANYGLAIFSVFGSGVRPVAPHCTGSADGGEGSSCSREIELIFDREYQLTVKRDVNNERVWKGFVEDTTTGKSIEIGAWQPREGSEGISGTHVGFVEYYPLINSCSKIPFTEVHFGAPHAESELSGVVEKPQVYGRCGNAVDFNTEKSGTGWMISLKGQ